MPMLLVRRAVRSSNLQRRTLATLALAVAILLPGCIASDGSAVQLSASEGSGSFVVHLSMQDGVLAQADAWWAEDAPELQVELGGTIAGWQAVVLKNDVVVTEQPLRSTPDGAAFVWRSGDAGVVAQAGDTFEILVVNGTAERALTSWSIEIEP